MASQKLTLRKLVATDLAVNTGRTGFFGGVMAAFSDPSFSTIFLHRIACRAAHTSGLGLISKLVWRMNVSLSGCHIHRDASIGQSFKLPHPTGIVVGVGAQIGDSVTIYQNVTLGRGLRDPRYPVIGDGAIIYPNSVIVGGITVGARAVVGAGSVVIADVPSGAIVSGNPARILRSI